VNGGPLFRPKSVGAELLLKLGCTDLTAEGVVAFFNARDVTQMAKALVSAELYEAGWKDNPTLRVDPFVLGAEPTPTNS
jgi:hypothetical protein